jgi:hypothetical protein
MLFMALAPVVLTEDNDLIKWNWTFNGQYSVAFVYDCQFLGAMSNYPAPTI